jgi:plasmid stability protein
MPSITVRDVPQETRDELAARAAGAGQSLQEYLRSTLVELAGKPDLETILARARARALATESTVPADVILEHLEADRR